MRPGSRRNSGSGETSKGVIRPIHGIRGRETRRAKICSTGPTGCTKIVPGVQCLSCRHCRSVSAFRIERDVTAFIGGRGAHRGETCEAVIHLVQTVGFSCCQCILRCHRLDAHAEWMVGFVQRILRCHRHGADAQWMNGGNGPQLIICRIINGWSLPRFPYSRPSTLIRPVLLLSHTREERIRFVIIHAAAIAVTVALVFFPRLSRYGFNTKFLLLRWCPRWSPLRRTEQRARHPSRSQYPGGGIAARRSRILTVLAVIVCPRSSFEFG
mmetsp:Transcript_3939/g.8835  ORF Transcript_3939/g.8835 Transcript_3939/m.8835 type:complete len:269 (+) Transcript_3939:274-1080(+)